MILKWMYSFFIQPLEYIMEMLFYTLMRLSGQNAGAALIGLGICVSLMSLPLYLRADAIQKSITQKKKDIGIWEKHIKKAFRGDERFMMLNRYYSITGYHASDPIKAALPLILQIPFFTAAYHMLTNAAGLSGIAFAGIPDLSLPDAMLCAGDIRINILPVVMTLINIVSAVIYTRGMSLNQKLQPWILALVFLVLLYDSPSGLVIYWLTNNLFSLFKNLVQKLLPAGMEKKPGIQIRGGAEKSPVPAAALALTVLNGIIIPLNTIASSPADFVDPYHYVSPFHYCLSALIPYAGLFLFWGGIIYYLAGKKGKKVFGIILYSLLIMGTVMYATVGHKLGLISNTMVYERYRMHSEWEVLLGAWLGLVIPAVVIYLYRYESFIKKLGISVLIAGSLFGVFRGAVIAGYLKSVEIHEEKDASLESLVILGKEQRNVMVIMLDRAISCYLPFIMEENPILYEQLSGFTWYPNTVSPGTCTFTGAPGLFGGYEYVPESMQKRKDESYSEKFTQALLLMPCIFKADGARVTVCDSPYGERMMGDPDEVFRSYGVKSVTTRGRYTGELKDTAAKERNFFFYSMFRCVMPIIGEYIYDGGYYLSCGERKEADDIFMSNYSVLEKLPQLTVVDSELKENSVFIIDNEITHSPHLLNTDGYRPDPEVKKEGYIYPGKIYAANKELELKDYPQTAHYHSNAAALLRLGEWFDTLREQGVWDNTRIIIVSDHGDDLGQLFKLEPGAGIEAVNCMLMVKDYGAEGFDISDEFMTNADVPAIAFEGVVASPVNPFTGKAVDSSAKNDTVKVFFSRNENVMMYNGDIRYAVDLSDGPVYRISGDIFDESCWVKTAQ